jgi:restriction system protein
MAMALWMVRAGKHGERESYALENSLVSIGWNQLPDLTTFSQKPELAQVMATTYAEESPRTISNWAGQVWTFAKSIVVGDIVAMPLKSTPAIAFGRVVTGYTYVASTPDAPDHHRIGVTWLPQIQRSEIDADLLYSFGAIMTVCQISRNQAEARIRAKLQIGPPVLTPTASIAVAATGDLPTPSEETAAPVNLEELANDAIRQHIARKFDGHEFAQLVEAVLNAQGFKTYLAPPGPDGGIDVLAGEGAHGFDGTRLAVQVKSGSIVVDTGIFREFKGVMESFGATQGLIVSWGGFKASVLRDLPAHFFKIRMWNADELIRQIVRHYDALPPTIQARLPLKRVWMLVSTIDDE